MTTKLIKENFDGFPMLFLSQGYSSPLYLMIFSYNKYIITENIQNQTCTSNKVYLTY